MQPLPSKSQVIVSQTAANSTFRGGQLTTLPPAQGWSCRPPHLHTCTGMHADRHGWSQMHANVFACTCETHSLSCILQHAHAQACTHTHAHTHSRTHTHAFMYTTHASRAYIHLNVPTHINACAPLHPHSPPMYMFMCARTHTHTHAHTHTYTVFRFVIRLYTDF